MDRHHFDDEDREEQLIEATRSHFSALSRAVIAGEPVATKRITNALNEFVADDAAAAELVRAVLLNSQAALTVLTDLIWDEASELAEADVAAMEKGRAESYDENRIDRAVLDRALH